MILAKFMKLRIEFHFSSEIFWGLLPELLKCPIKVRKILETCLICDLGDRQFCFLEQVTGFVDAEFVLEFGIGFASPLLEKPAKCFLAHVCGFCYFFEADVAVVLSQDKSHDIAHALAFKFRIIPDRKQSVKW